MSGRTTGCSSWCCGAPGAASVGRSPGGRRPVGELSRARPVRAGRGAAGARRARRAAGPRRRGDAASPTGPTICAEIVYIDRYGNALTGLRGAALARRHAWLPPRPGRLPARDLLGGAARAAFWYVNSNGLVEIAVNGGRADRALGLGIGTTSRCSAEPRSGRRDAPPRHRAARERGGAAACRCSSHMPPPIAIKTPSMTRLNERAMSPSTARKAWPRK